MPDYTLSNRKYWSMKAGLKRAVREGNPTRIVAAVKAAREVFDREGYPDDWALWRNALWDIPHWERTPAISDAIRAEEDQWH